MKSISLAMIDQMVWLIISELEDQLIPTIFAPYPSDRQLDLTILIAYVKNVAMCYKYITLEILYSTCCLLCTSG